MKGPAKNLIWKVPGSKKVRPLPSCKWFSTQYKAIAPLLGVNADRLRTVLAVYDELAGGVNVIAHTHPFHR